MTNSQTWRRGDEQKLYQLGCITNILARHTHFSLNTFSWLRSWTENAIAHKQLEIFYYQGAPVGYIAWAYLTEDVIGRILYSDYIPHWSEWYEGDFLWIMDYCMLQTYQPREVIDIFCKVFSEERYVFWSMETSDASLVFRLDVAKKRVSSMPKNRFMETIGKRSIQHKQMETG